MKTKHSMKTRFGLYLVILLLLLAILGQLWTPYGVNAMSYEEVALAPSFSHLMGTDNYGRDIFSRVIQGLGTTFLVAALTVGAGGILGMILGSLSGYIGGLPDSMIMRLCDIILSFPSVLLTLLLISFFGPGTRQVILALSILFVPSFAKMARGEVIHFKEQDFVLSARVQRIPPLRILFLHVLPNAKSTLLNTLAIGFNNAVLAEASMSYLGFGVQPPVPSLGRMLFEAQGHLGTMPWYALFPGLFMVLLILGFALLSEGLKGGES